MYYNEMLDISVSSSAIMNMVLLICIATTLGLYGWVKFEVDSIQQALFPKIVLDKETHQKQNFEQEQLNGEIPPPLCLPEALTLHQQITNQDMFSPYDDLPLPGYLDY